MGLRIFTMAPMWELDHAQGKILMQDINTIAILVGGFLGGGEGGFGVGGGKQQQQPCRKDRGGRKRGPTCLRQTTTHVDANPKD
jgi:hypothetical protein